MTCEHGRAERESAAADGHCPICLANENDRLEEALTAIVAWSRAYPLKVFPEPDFAKAAELLKAGGMTLDAISASNMRHVVEGVGKIARAALEPKENGE
jgi:hypothetical protein